MPKSFATLADFLRHGFDTVIDVRSPAEYAEDHVPGAISLPVLSNDQRAEVGTIYKQVSAFDARKRGAALVARNAADHIAGPLSHHDGGWRPLVYCWRGGQRSGSFASILQQIGWRAEIVEGGYRTWRRLVTAALYDAPLAARVVLLDGNTGTAKTAVLGRLSAMGHQVIDLEGLANHRGSVLGRRSGGQPSQKSFESRLAVALDSVDPDRPLIVEAESSKVGDLVIPPCLWSAMCAAPRIEIAAPLAARAAYAAIDYADLAADSARLKAVIEPLRHIRGHAIVDGWQALLARDDLVGLSAALMADHYDLSYARSRGRHDRPLLARISSETLDDAGIESIAARIAAILTQI